MNELVNDLNYKIEELNLTVSSADDSIREKAAQIGNKAASVLGNVRDKTIDLSREVNSEEELLSAIDTIRIKADSLYNEALQKISDLQAEATVLPENETKDDIEELIDDEIADSKEEYQSFEEETTEAAEEKKADIVRSETSEKALEVLRDWLLPKEVQK